MKTAAPNADAAPRGPTSRSRRSFFRDVRAAAATELALIAPVGFAMLGLIVLGGQGFELEGKVALVARTVTDLVAQTPYVKNPTTPGATSLRQSDLDTDLALSSEIIYPNSTATLTVVVSELSVDSENATGSVVWSEGYNGGVPLTVGTLVPLGASIIATGATYLIYGQVQYVFSPLGISQPVGSVTLSGSEMLVPRNAAQISISWGQ